MSCVSFCNGLLNWCDRKITFISNIVCVILNINIENSNHHNSKEEEKDVQCAWCSY